MVSNLRSRPIEGHITDSAGNVLRNAQVVIKQPAPSGSFVIDSMQSDDDGYFISKPVPNGVYDIYESGIKVSRIIHQAIGAGIPAFQADIQNYDINNIGNFQSLASTARLNKFKSFIQIEPSSVDVSQYGNIFQIYDVDVSQNPVIDNDELYHMALFFGFNSHSRITTTRFDVEYFAPITALSSAYKRVRWAGVPGIRFYEDSSIILPLDYYSIIPSLNKILFPSGILNDGDVTVNTESSQGEDVIVIEGTTPDILNDLINNISVGDILKCHLKNSTTYRYWYGIVTKISTNGTAQQIELERWKSSRFVSDHIHGITDMYVKRVFAYSAMFPNLMAVNEEANQRFCVTENNSAQNNDSELYNYNDQY